MIDIINIINKRIVRIVYFLLFSAFVFMLFFSIFFLLNKKSESITTEEIKRISYFPSLSNFGDFEYECTGKCFCYSEEENERRISSTISNSLKVFLSAVSVTVAYKIAKDRFHTQCNEEYSDSLCSIQNSYSSSSHILSEVDDCKKKKSQFQRITSENLEKMNQEGSVRRYYCKGHCVNLPEHHDNPIGFEDFMEIGYKKIGLCEGITFESRIAVQHLTSENSQDYLQITSMKFAMGPLSEHCQKNSILSSEDFTQTLKDKARESVVEIKKKRPEIAQMAEKFQKQIPFCVGAIIGLERGELGVSSLENVNCVEEQ